MLVSYLKIGSYGTGTISPQYVSPNHPRLATSSRHPVVQERSKPTAKSWREVGLPRITFRDLGYVSKVSQQLEDNTSLIDHLEGLVFGQNWSDCKICNKWSPWRSEHTKPCSQANSHVGWTILPRRDWSSSGGMGQTTPLSYWAIRLVMGVGIHRNH